MPQQVILNRNSALKQLEELYKETTHCNQEPEDGHRTQVIFKAFQMSLMGSQH